MSNSKDPNRIPQSKKPSASLSEQILRALNNFPGGSIAYLEQQRDANPKAFLGLLGKILPTQITGMGDDPISISVNIIKSE